MEFVLLALVVQIKSSGIEHLRIFLQRRVGHLEAFLMSRTWIVASLLVATMGAFTPFAGGQLKKIDAEGHEWWQHAVFYEVYPRSFADSNDDGIGDLNGITSKLGYLQNLGVNAIWITPCFPSPQIDFGYDVSDYENIDPMYGTLVDFDRLVAEGKNHGIKIILDFVPNHTSDQHKWFLESKSSRTSPKRDWYIWRDGKGPNQPPNNWTSTFGGSAWKYDPETGQYYYHYFYAEQPDLNWRNPEVKQAMLDSMRFWYKRGVAGFRVDAVDTLFEDPDLKDNPSLPGNDKFGFPNTHEIYNKKLPEVHDVMREMRKAADEYGAVLIGETWTQNVAQLREYYGERNDELQMPMDLMMTEFKTLSAPVFREHIGAVESAGGWPVFVISNHDIMRSYSRWGDGVHNDEIAKMIAALYLMLRGTAPAGFTGGTPWLPVAPSYKARNVAMETSDPDSILSFYRRLLELRREEPALRDGQYVALNQDDANVFAFVRRFKGEAVVVAMNMSGATETVKLDLAKAGFPVAKLRVLASSSRKPAKKVSAKLSMEPFSVVIAKIDH